MTSDYLTRVSDVTMPNNWSGNGLYVFPAPGPIVRFTILPFNK